MTTSSAWRLLPLALVAACSALINPDENRLAPPSDAPPVAVDAVADAAPPADVPPSMDTPPVDVPAPDAPAPDVPTPDVPTPDVPTPDVPTPDVPTTRCPGGCDDGIACTVDTCDEAAGRCVSRPDDGRCPTGAVCDVSTHGCVHRECSTDAQCPPGDLCNGSLRCESNRCVRGPRVNCDDGVACTMDSCAPNTGVCTHAPDAGLCPRRGACTAPACGATGCTYAAVPGACDSFCTPGRACDEATGACAGGAPRNCSDLNPCTMDSCNAGAGRCDHAPRDDDHDGYPAATEGTVTCAGGTDCDDHNPNIHPGATEVCNGVDNNCDGRILDCMHPGDTCEEAIPIELFAVRTGMYAGSTDGYAHDYDGTCGGDGPDVVFVVTAPADADVTLEADGTPASVDPVLTVRPGCGAPEVACNDDAAAASGTLARVWLRPTESAAAAQVWYVTLGMQGSGGGYTFRASAHVPGTAPATCAGPAPFDVSAGGTLFGTYARGASTHHGSCGGMTTSEDVVVFNTMDRPRVELGYREPGDTLYVRHGACEGPMVRELACAAGSAGMTTTVRMEMGTNYIFADGGSATNLHYSLSVHP